MRGLQASKIARYKENVFVYPLSSNGRSKGGASRVFVLQTNLTIPSSETTSCPRPEDSVERIESAWDQVTIEEGQMGR
jgi:hypothetical protein